MQVCSCKETKVGCLTLMECLRKGTLIDLLVINCPKNLIVYSQ